MNGITELAKLFKQRENNRDYSPMLGKVLDIEDIKICIGEKIILDSKLIKSCIILTEEHIGREIVLLPYADGQNFFVIGMVN